MSGGLMNVSVDRDFARFGSKSYAINKINTVDVRERKPHGQLGMFIFGVLCFIFGMAALGGLSEKSLSGSITSFIFAAIFGYIAYRLWLRSKIVEYQLFLMTSSSEAQAITSRDGEMIAKLRDRIEAAMMAA